MNIPEIASLVVTLIVGTVGGGGLIAWLNRGKIKAETGEVEIRGQLQIVDRFSTWNKELLERVEKLEKAAAADRKAARDREDKLEGRIHTLEMEVLKLERENEALRGRCRRLEGENAELKGQIDETA